MDLSGQLASPMRFQEELRAKSQEDLPMSQKKKRTRGGWKIMPFIIGNESCANIAVTSLSANLVVFLLTKFHMNLVEAANISTVWGGTNYIAPIVGAFIADCYLGRFWVIVLGSITYVLALGLMTVISWYVSSLRGSSVGLVLLYLFLLLMTVGSSGVKSCSIPFGAEQFDVSDEEGKKKQQSFFNLYYCAATVSVMFGLTFLVYLQSNSWTLGFGVATALMVISTIFFLMGTNHYVYSSPEGSVFTGFAQVIVASIRKRNLELPLDPKEFYETASEKETGSRLILTDQFMFFNKAAIIRTEDFNSNDMGSSIANPWMLCPAQKIEDLKSVLTVLPIWCVGIIVAIILMGTSHTYMVYQARLVDRKLGPHFELPLASFAVFALLTISLWLPIYDKIIIPLFRRLTKRPQGITQLERIGVGLLMSVLTMFVAGLVEVKRKESIKPISGFWLVPQWTLFGFAEAFYAIGLIEFFYEKFPKNMRSTAVALFWCSMGIGLLLSSLVITLVHKFSGGEKDQAWLPQDLNRGHLEYFYWLLAGLGLLNFFYFVACTRLVKHLLQNRTTP